MKVVFLDVDGVLNCVEDWVEADTIGHPHNHGCDQINRTKIALLQRIVRETECKIVLSSTWRKCVTLDKFHEMLKIRGFYSPRDVIIGQTPEVPMADRGDEIKKWIEDWDENNGLIRGKVEKYVILDDDSDMLEEQAPYFVKTDNKRGLSYDDAIKAISILNNDPPNRMLTQYSRL